jgi:hypothetical protein
MNDNFARAEHLDLMAGYAYRAGHLHRALGLIELASWSFPECAELWRQREARIRSEMARCPDQPAGLGIGHMEAS